LTLQRRVATTSRPCRHARALPYFEVDLVNTSGVNTLLTINNASASSALAHVTLWTDQSVPTLTFDIYLTGYDVQKISLAKVFRKGKLPRTADAQADPQDNISNQGPLSQDINFPGAVGPCQPGMLYGQPLDDATQMHLRRSHTGKRSPLLNGCAGRNYGDSIARGYVTVDTVTQCNLSFPSSPGYFTGIADSRNILWGDYEYVIPVQNFASASPLVHVESCIPANGYLGYVGNGAGFCPFAPGDYTFYGRYVAFAATDQREPLATTFATRYVSGGSFDAGTDLIVWRDAKDPTPASYNCSSGSPAWLPLDESDVVAFDEQENPTDLCTGGGCFPLEAQRVPVVGLNLVGEDLDPPSSFGWLFLNLNHAGGSNLTGIAQAWVTTTQSSSGRYSVGFPAIPLDNATTTVAGGQILIP
jgi:hypothetical protein